GLTTTALVVSVQDAATQLDQLDSATAYIKQLKGRIDHLKRRKQAVFSGGTAGCSSSVSAGDYKAQTAALPVIEVRHQDGTLDVALASEAGRPFRLHQVIAVLEQEGAEVLSASFSVVGDKIFYTLHSQALCPRIGLEAGRAAHRLRGLAAAAAVSSSVLLT
uniref:BHLH domain-containing protein n=1 Tax=Triticum urartu TaxID=4572 RepID=A0A8R7TPU8_TRIUA